MLELSNVQNADMLHVVSFDLIESNQYVFSFDVRKLSMRPGNAGPCIPLEAGSATVYVSGHFEAGVHNRCQHLFPCVAWLKFPGF